MHSNIKKLWVEALRSGNYVQGRNALKKIEENKTQHCCLGVLCEVYQENVATKMRSEKEACGESEIYTFDGSVSYLPTAVRDWAFLNSHNPRVKNKDGLTHGLSNFNDYGIYSFNDIADMIEKSL